jgi:serine/threonine protein kinase
MIPLGDQLVIARQLFTFFSAMHARGYIHGDIKLENFLYYDANRVGVTDFGMSFPQEQQPPVRTRRVQVQQAVSESTGRKVFNQGTYGTVKYTSPELLGAKFFGGDLTKTESWALGCVLYSLHFGRATPWEHFLDANRELFGSVDSVRKLQEDMKSWPEGERKDVEARLGKYITKRLSGKVLTQTDATQVDKISKQYLIEKTREVVENRFQELQNLKRPLTPDEQFEAVIFGLLRLSPEARLSMDQANKIVQSIGQP